MIRSLFVLAVSILTSPATLAAGPSVKDALAFEPIQANVDYERPTAADAEKATIKAEKEGKATAWVVRNGSNQLLRRFADTNADNMVDQWSYFKDGREVYRDIDGNFNGKADQYRWFHMSGTRWGIDANEDGDIESWKVISPHEVAELAVTALAQRDARLFSTLIATEREITAAGMGDTAATEMTKSTKAAISGFAKMASDQKSVSSGSKFLNFGASRPGLVPAGTDGSTRDVIYYDNVTALVETGGKPEQVFLGQLIAIDNTWKLVTLPQLGDDAAPTGPYSFAAQVIPGGNAGGAAPSDEMQTLMDELYKLEGQAESAGPDAIGKLTQRRTEILLRLAQISPRDQQNEWYGQLADMLSAAVTTHGYSDGIQSLDRLIDQLRRQKADDDTIAHVQFRRIWAEYGLAQRDPKADVAKNQASWLESLEKFASDHPESPDASEAMLQLGMGNEFAGETEVATKWYRKLATDFPDSLAGPKAAGAIRRLDSIGKAIPLAGKSLDGSPLDLRSYRGKVVVVQYWATWCGPCKDDMKKLAELYAKYNRNGFEVIGVNLDSSNDLAKAYVTQQRIPWKILADGDGLDGRLANEMGVNTLPLMLLVDGEGKVVSRSLYITEVEDELKRLLTK